MSSLFHMKDLGTLSVFLGIEVERSSQGLFLSEKKYVTDILKEFHMTKCKSLNLPMAYLKLTANSGDPLPKPDIFQRLIGKLIYLTITRPDISYPIQILSQFMNQPTTSHLQAAFRVPNTYLNLLVKVYSLLPSSLLTLLHTVTVIGLAAVLLGDPRVAFAFFLVILLSHGNPKSKLWWIDLQLR